MPAYTLELSYLVPVYQHVTIEERSAEEASRIAVETQDWMRARTDYEASSEVYVSGIWRGRDAAYASKPVRIPKAFGQEQRTHRTR